MQQSQALTQSSAHRREVSRKTLTLRTRTKLRSFFVLTSCLFMCSTRSGSYSKGVNPPTKTNNTGNDPGTSTRRTLVCELLVCKMAVESGKPCQETACITSRLDRRYTSKGGGRHFAVGACGILRPFPSSDVYTCRLQLFLTTCRNEYLSLTACRKEAKPSSLSAYQPSAFRQRNLI